MDEVSKWMWWRVGMRFRLAMAAFGLVALLALIEGLLHGPWWQAVAGAAVAFALFLLAIRGIPIPQSWIDRFDRESTQLKRPDGSRSWPLIIAGLLWALLCFAFAAISLFAPFEDLVSINKGVGDLIVGLAKGTGEGVARFLVAAFFAGVGVAVVHIQWKRYRTDE